MIKTLLKSLLLAAILIYSPITDAQVGQKFPKNVRYIGGGYNNERPFFKTLEAALNDVKAYATVSNPYAFWISSDTTWITDWSTMKDSINDYYIASGKIMWLPFQLTDLTNNNDSLSYIFDGFVFANQYLTSGGTVNDSIDVYNMFTAALGKTLIFTDSIYAWSSIMDIDCNNSNIAITSSNNTLLNITAQNPEQEYFAFWTGRGIDRPEVGDIYSTGGSQFELVDTVITENFLGRRISGSGTIAASGTLTRVTGSGNASYSYTTLITQDGRYYLPLGAIGFNNAAKINISNIRFQFDNSGSYTRAGGTFFDGVLIKNSNNVTFTKNSITDAVQWGIRLYNCDNVNLTYNTIDSCLLGGIGFNAVHNGNIGWNTIENIGVDAPANGYGISMSHQGGTWENNENITIIGNTVNYCLRKGIDIHGGVGLKVMHNTVKGFGDKGIGGYNLGGFEYGHLNQVGDLSITDNIIENDSVWYSNIAWGYGKSGYDEPYVIAIPVGAYDFTKPVSGDEQSQVIISGNVIKNLTVYQGDTLVSISAIRVFTGYTGTVLISGNVVSNSTLIHGISVADGNDAIYTTQLQNLDITNNSFTDVNAVGLGTDAGAIILATAGEFVNISNNKLIRCSAYGSYGIWTQQISPNILSNVKINNNVIDGDTSAGFEKGIGYGIYIRTGTYQANNNSFSGNILTGRCIVPYITLSGSAINNTYFTDSLTAQTLPDYTSNTSGKFNITFIKDTTSSVDTIATLMVNGGTSYPYAINGIASFSVNVMVSSNLSTEQSIYKYFAWCKNDTTGIDTTLGYIETVTFGIDTLTSQVFEGTEDFPALNWQNIADEVPATGRLRRLDIYCDKPESTYKVEIEFQGYKLMPYFMTH